MEIEFKSTGNMRQLDSLGRLVFPSALRKYYGLHPGSAFEIFELVKDGDLYLCFKLPKDDGKVERAKLVVEDNT